MQPRRTIPPAASPISLRNILNGLLGLMRPEKEIARFQNELKEYFGVKHCFLVSSGKAALKLILHGLHDLHPDRRAVLIPAFCCYSVPSAIVSAGLDIRLCDVNPGTMDFNFGLLEKAVSETAAYSVPPPAGTGRPGESRLLAILPAHLFGLVADVEFARRQVADPEVTVIEDAAQVMGAEATGRKLGTIGDVGFFSLGRGKALSTVEGGVIVTNNEDIAGSITRRMDNVSTESGFEVLRKLLMAVALSVFQRPTLFWIPKSYAFSKDRRDHFRSRFPGAAAVRISRPDSPRVGRTGLRDSLKHAERRRFVGYDPIAAGHRKISFPEWGTAGLSFVTLSKLESQLCGVNS